MRSGTEIILNLGQEISSEFSININEDLRNNYEQMFYYLSRNKMFQPYIESGNEKVFDKGLFLYGDVGAGKSWFFKFLKRFYYRTEGFIYDRIEIVPFREIEKFYREDGAKVWEEYGGNLHTELAVDEVVKDENITHKHYGNEENVFEELILERYNLFIEKGIKTHFTTNASPSQIKTMFHDRVSDRIKEMCNVHFWEGKSLRK